MIDIKAAYQTGLWSDLHDALESHRNPKVSGWGFAEHDEFMECNRKRVISLLLELAHLYERGDDINWTLPEVVEWCAPDLEDE